MKMSQIAESKPYETTYSEIGEIKELVRDALVPILVGMGELGKLGGLGNLGQLGNLGHLGGLWNLGALPQFEQSAYQNALAAHNLNMMNHYPSSHNSPYWGQYPNLSGFPSAWQIP